MDKIKNYIIISLVILILLVLCTFLGYKYIELKNKPANQIISTITEVHIDTLRYTDSLWYPVPVIIEKPVFDSIIDTVFVVQDYYSNKIYEYKFKDTNLSITSSIIIHKNKLISLFQDYEIYRKTTTITNNFEVVKPPKFMLFGGGGIDYCNNQLGLNFAVSVYFDKNDVGIFYDPILKAFGLSYKRALIYK